MLLHTYSYKQIREVAQSVNERKRQAEMLSKVWDMQRNIIGCKCFAIFIFTFSRL